MHYLKDCTIEGYEGYFSQWEIEAEGAQYGRVLDFCQRYCEEKQFTKERFLNDLKYTLSLCTAGRHQFNINSFYELEYDENKNIWIYTVRSILQDFV